MAERGCPDGMYPLDVYYETNEFDTFEELKDNAERGSNVLNVPLSWYFTPDEDDDGEQAKRFTLVFAMPRKDLRTWSVSTTQFDRPVVEQWLKEWIPTQFAEWFGWPGLRVQEDQHG